MSLSKELAIWICDTRFEDLPEDVVAATKLRVLDVIGLALAGAETDFGRSVRADRIRQCREPRRKCVTRRIQAKIAEAQHPRYDDLIDLGEHNSHD